MNYIEYIKLLESNKDRFFDKNVNLNDTEKAYYKKLFKELSGLDSKIKNWTFNLKKEDFDKVIYDYDNNFKKLPTETLSDLKKGEDYEYLGELHNYKIYFIYTHKASYTIASNNVGLPIWTKLPYWYEGSNIKDDYIYDRSTDRYSGAKWCTAMHHTDQYFEDYIKNNHTCFLYCVADSKEDELNRDSTSSDTVGRYAKLAIALSLSNKIYSIYDAIDNYFEEHTSQQQYFQEFQDFIDRNITTIKNCVSKLYNGLYEFISLEELRGIIENELDRLYETDSIKNSIDALLCSSNINLVDLFMDNIDEDYINNNNHGDFVVKTLQSLEDFLNKLEKACFHTEDKLSILNSLKTYVPNAFITRRTYYFGGHSYYSNSLLDFYSCLMDYFTDRYSNFEDPMEKDICKAFIEEMNFLFSDIETLTTELIGYVKPHRNIFKQTYESCTSWSFEAHESILKGIQKANNLTSIMYALIDRSGVIQSHAGIEMMGDEVSIVVSRNPIDRLQGFFAGIAQILFKHIKINNETADSWFYILSTYGKEPVSYEDTRFLGTSPTTCLIYCCEGYCFNRDMLDSLLGVNTIGRYMM